MCARDVMTRHGLIVVGVDGSSDARRALDWAIDEARRRNDAVLAVHAWTTGQAVDFAWRSRALLRKESAALLTATVRDAGRRGTGVTLSWSSVEGDAATVLLDAARGADLLVLAAHRGTAPADWPLGSVTATCLGSATVPVVVVPAPLLRRAPGTHAGPQADLVAYSPAFIA